MPGARLGVAVAPPKALAEAGAERDPKAPGPAAPKEAVDAPNVGVAEAPNDSDGVAEATKELGALDCPNRIAAGAWLVVEADPKSELLAADDPNSPGLEG
jgi:hypothetical protein